MTISIPTPSLPTLVAGGIAVVVLGVGGAMTNVGPWYRDLRKPSWNPPNWAFGPAWTVILGLAAWAGALAWGHAQDSAARTRIGVLYGVNILFHLLWSPLFFNLRRPDWALVEVVFLWVSILALIIGLAPIAPAAAWMLGPYIAWVSFAAFLNLTIVRMNPPFGEAARMARQAAE
jgi:tryptophan-rich sensory protein